MVATVEKLGGKGRGIAVISPDTITDEELDYTNSLVS